MMALPENLHFLSFDKIKLGKIWEELRDFCWYLGEGEYSDPVFFTKVFTAPDSVILESSYGYFVIERIKQGNRAEVHLPLTDHKLSAHIPDIQAGLVWLFTEFDLRRVETNIYGFQRAVRRFLTKIGFQHEGTLRKRAMVRGEWRDVEMYSILREEIFNG